VRGLRTPTRIRQNGQGLALKLAINISLAVQMLAFSEGLLLAERDGVDRKRASDVMTQSAIGSPMLKLRVPLVLDLPQEAWFDVGLMRKDIRLALAMAGDLGIRLPSTGAAAEMLDRAVELGYERSDIASLFEVLARTNDALAGASGFSLSASLVALSAFCLGAVWGGRLGTHLGPHRIRLLAAAGVVEAVLVAASVVVAATAGASGSGAPRYVLIVLLGLTMGGQNAVARRLAVRDLTTTVLTLTITGIFADSRLAGGPSSKVGRRLLSPLALFAGGLAGALLVLR